MNGAPSRRRRCPTGVGFGSPPIARSIVGSWSCGARYAHFLEQARERIARRPELREAPENLLEAVSSAEQADGSLHRRG